jgi:hypothetical protein
LSITAHGKQIVAIHQLILNQKSSTPTSLEPNDILEKFFINSEFHFLNTPPTPPTAPIDT